MTTLRRVWLGSLVVALVAFSTVRAVDPKYLPNDTEIVFSVNLKQILDSPLVQGKKDAVDQAKTALTNQLGDNPVLNHLKNAGFDVFRDLHSITVASKGDVEPTAIIVEGTFNIEKLTAAAEDAAKEHPEALKITRVGSHRVFEITPPGDKAGFAALVGGKILVATMTRDALTDTLARLDGTKSFGLKKEFAVLLDTVNNRQSINFVATGGALAKLVAAAPIPNGEAVTAALQTIEGLSGAITVGTEVQFQLGINAKDEGGAKKMAQDANGNLLLGQLLVNQMAQKDEKLAPAVDVVRTLRITSQGSNVLLRGSVSIDVIEKLMKSIPQ